MTQSKTTCPDQVTSFSRSRDRLAHRPGLQRVETEVFAPAPFGLLPPPPGLQASPGAPRTKPPAWKRPPQAERWPLGSTELGAARSDRGRRGPRSSRLGLRRAPESSARKLGMSEEKEVGLNQNLNSRLLARQNENHTPRPTSRRLNNS